MENNLKVLRKVISNEKDILVAIIVAILIVLAAIALSFTLNLNIVESLVMSWILTTFYAVFAFFLVSSNTTIEINRETTKFIEIDKPVIREIEKPVYIQKFIEKQVIKEVPIQIPIEKEIINVVDRPVFYEIEKPVYIKEERKRLNIPKFNFMASSETKTFHKRTCRLGKLIKKKYKIHSNSQTFFKKKKYRPCKVCIKKTKKI